MRGGAAEEEVPLGSRAYLAAIRSEAAKISLGVRDVQVSLPGGLVASTNGMPGISLPNPPPPTSRERNGRRRFDDR
jgi:hypothetical protein